MRGENIIIFSSDDWSSGLKTSKYHIARQLAVRNRVFFVNSVGLRAPTAAPQDLKRALRKLLAFLRGPVEVSERLYVYTPIVFPFSRGTVLVKYLNGILLRLCFCWIKRKVSLTNPIALVFSVAFNDVIATLGEKAILYYCIDDLRSFAGVEKGWFDREEARLLSQVNCVIACSQELYAALRRKARRTYYVPHGVDWSSFRKAVEEELPLPYDLRHIPQPRLGFYGFLSEEWVDFSLLRQMAAEHPQWHVVLIGKPSATLDLEALVPEPNIHYLGLKPFEELPAYTRHFAVGLIPFIANRITHHCSPLKLLEYLSGGLPVVSTDIPEVRKYAGDVYVARSHEEFIALCEKALSEGDPQARERRSRAGEIHSWEKRVEQICRIVQEEIEAQTARSQI